MASQTSSSSSASHSNSGGHGSGDASRASMFLLRHQQNESAMRYWAAGVCGIILLVTLTHWTRRLYVKINRRGGKARQTPFWARPWVWVSRKIRPHLLHPRPLIIFPSTSSLLLTLSYTIINTVILFYPYLPSNVTVGTLANRTGWLTLLNLLVTIFLSLKHTPLAPLTSTSYERLNPIHQISGYSTLLFTILHGALYTVIFYPSRKEILERDSDISGIIAGVFMLLMCCAPLLLKTRYYEWFYTCHILVFLGLAVSTALHQPTISLSSAATLTIIFSGLWGLDRLVRTLRMVGNLITGNRARLYPLAHGGTRVVLEKAPLRAKAGKHVFLWIPAVGPLQTHPFTSVDITPSSSSHPTPTSTSSTKQSSSSSDFVISSHSGFTHRLHQLAQSHPGIPVLAGADGAYGAFPTPCPTSFDKLILVAGGSGASFTFGMALNMLRRAQQHDSLGDNESRMNIKTEFIWAVKNTDTLDWFDRELKLLREHPHAPNVRVSLHVTRLPEAGEGTTTTQAGVVDGDGVEGKSDGEASVEKLPPIQFSSEGGLQLSSTATPNILTDEEKEIGVASASSSSSRPGSSGTGESRGSHRHHKGHPLRIGRPDLLSEIQSAVRGVPPEHRILIAACGPAQMMKVVKSAAAKSITTNGPSVEVHCESFGW